MMIHLQLTKREKIILAVIFFYIAYIIFPLFADITHIPIQIPALFVVAALAIYCPKAFYSTPMKWLYVYISIMFIYGLCGKYIHINGVGATNSFTNKIIIESAQIMPAVVILAVLKELKNVKLYKYIGLGTVILLFLSFIFILPLIIASANILREDIGEIEVVRPIGLPDYALMHAYTLIYVTLLLYYREAKFKNRWILVFVLLLFAFVITRTAVTTSLLIIIFSTIFIFAYNPHRITQSSFWVGMFALFLYIFYKAGIFLVCVDAMIPYFEGTAVEPKLADFHISLTHNKIEGGSMTVRMMCHDMSKRCFMADPMLGTKGVGGHSKILDILGSMGLVAFIPFAMVFLSSLKAHLSQIKEKYLKYNLIIIYAISLIYLYSKGIFGCSGWLFLYVLCPSIIHIQRKQ